LEVFRVKNDEIERKFVEGDIVGNFEEFFEILQTVAVKIGDKEGEIRVKVFEKEENLVVFVWVGSFVEVFMSVKSQFGDNGGFLRSQFEKVFVSEMTGTVLDVDLTSREFDAKHAEDEETGETLNKNLEYTDPERYQLLVSNNGDMFSQMIKFCLPGAFSYKTAKLHKCYKTKGEEFGFGLQTEKSDTMPGSCKPKGVHDLDSPKFSSGIKALSYISSCPDLEFFKKKSLTKFSTDKQEFSVSNKSIKYWYTDASNITCSFIKDCYNCSLARDCIYNNAETKCISISQASTLKQFSNLQNWTTRYLPTMGLTSLSTFDFASLKIHNTCPTPHDFDIFERNSGVSDIQFITNTVNEDGSKNYGKKYINK
jgi:hypothetical protein